MSRSNKSKIAVTLLGALAFGASDASAMNSNKNQAKNSQTLGAVGGATSDKNLKRIEKGLSILEKVLIGAGITLGAIEAANETVAGVMWAKGKKSDSILKGKYSITNLIRSKIKKDNKHLGPEDKNPENGNREPVDLGEQDDKSSNKKNIQPKEKENKKENLNDIKEIKNISSCQVSNSNIISPVSDNKQQNNKQQNKQQSIMRMNQMVNQMQPYLKQWGNSVVNYLSSVVISDPTGFNYEALFYISTGQGVITNCNYFQDHNIWCFGIEVTYRENNNDKKIYVYLAPGMQMPNGGYGVKSWASLYFQNGLVMQWPDSDNRGPLVCGTFV